MNSTLNEDVFREALGLPLAEKKQRVAPKNSPVRFISGSPEKKSSTPKPAGPKVVLVYTVRKKEGGPSFPYEFESNSINVFESELMAKKEMKKKGLVPWILLDRKVIN